jgi:HAD superfamily hydrolase (TIGR01549 family)
MGMGGDKLVPALLGEKRAKEVGDAVRDAEKERYMELVDEVRPLSGARELLVFLKERGHALVLASSAKEHEIDHYLDLLDARDLADAWTTSADVEATKPEPDLVHAALERIGGGPGVLVGDSTWDCEAAERAGVPCVAVLTGGFSEQELLDAGAVAVFDSLEAFRDGIGTTPLR